MVMSVCLVPVNTPHFQVRTGLNCLRSCFQHSLAGKDVDFIPIRLHNLYFGHLFPLKDERGENRNNHSGPYKSFCIERDPGLKDKPQGRISPKHHLFTMQDKQAFFSEACVNTKETNFLLRCFCLQETPHTRFPQITEKMTSKMHRRRSKSSVQS